MIVAGTNVGVGCCNNRQNKFLSIDKEIEWYEIISLTVIRTEVVGWQINCCDSEEKDPFFVAWISPLLDDTL